MDRIKIGVVGVGHLGNYHLQKYQKIPGVEIIGVSDVAQERAAEAAALYGCLSFKNHVDLIGAVDAVSIAVPTASHYQVARAFLAAGVDVLLEKPTASTVAEARELNDLARAKELIFQIGFVERFNPAIIALEKVIDRPLFIEAHRLHPFFARGTDVDVILDLMIHDLDIILKFVNAPLESVEAVGVSVLSPQVDIANARLSFENGCVANVTASRVTSKSMQKIRFFGLNGYHAIDYAKRELVSLSKKAQAGTQHDIVQNPVEVKIQDPLEEEIRSFVQAVSQRNAPLVSGVDALPALEAAAKITEKIRARAGLAP
jgi:predicted dehydrogenase